MTFPRPDFPASAVKAAQAHAAAEYPKESCGLIVDGAYRVCDNIADDPENDFRIAGSVIRDAGSGLQAILHSHPDGNAWPSKADMQCQIDFGIVFGLIPCIAGAAQAPVFWGDYRLDEPLIGRTFVSGVADCYALIRAWYWQEKGVKLPDFPHDLDWHKKGGDLYREGFKKAGFTRIEEKDAQPGDVFIGQVQSKVPNHGGILLENGLGLHHVDRRLSRREPIARYRHFITHWLRFTGLPE